MYALSVGHVFDYKAKICMLEGRQVMRCAARC